MNFGGILSLGPIPLCEWEREEGRLWLWEGVFWSRVWGKIEDVRLFLRSFGQC
jgi:hypothetical protein